MKIPGGSPWWVLGAPIKEMIKTTFKAPTSGPKEDCEPLMNQPFASPCCSLSVQIVRVYSPKRRFAYWRWSASDTML